MSFTIEFWDASNTFDCVQSGVSIEKYAMAGGDLRGNGDPVEEELVLVFGKDASTSQVTSRDLMASLKRLLSKAKPVGTIRNLNPVFIVFKWNTSDGAERYFRSELLEATMPDFPLSAMEEGARGTLRMPIRIKRRPYWYNATQTALYLRAPHDLLADALASPRVIRNGATGTGNAKNMFFIGCNSNVDTVADDITGDLPAPLTLTLQNDIEASGAIKEIVYGMQAHPLGQGMTLDNTLPQKYCLNAYDAASADLTLYNSSSVTGKTRTWTGLTGTTTYKLCEWLISKDVLAFVQGGPVKCVIRFPVTRGAAAMLHQFRVRVMYAGGVLPGTVELADSGWTDGWSNGIELQLLPLNTISLPPGGSKNAILQGMDFQRVSLLLEVRKLTSGAYSPNLGIQEIQLIPCADGFRHWITRGFDIPINSRAVDAFPDLWGPFVRDNGSPAKFDDTFLVSGDPLMLRPYSLHSLWLMYSCGAGLTSEERQWSVSVAYPPTRSSI